MIHKRTLHALEFPRVLERLASFCSSESARERALSLRPLEDPRAVEEEQLLFDEATLFASMANGGRGFAGTGDFPDIAPFLDTLRRLGPERASVDRDAFWAVKSVLGQAMRLRDAIRVPEGETTWPRLLALATNPPLPDQLHAALERCLGDDGNLRDESSPELFQVRVELRSLHQTALRRVKSYAERYNILGFLQDEFMTLSSDRYVLPFKANAKNRLQGVIHDWSQTGETCYFEPMFLVELNNRIQELKRVEREEEHKVLLYLAGMMDAAMDGTRAALNLLAELDFLHAKRVLAERTEGRCVRLGSESEGLELVKARHPLLLLAEEDVPADADRAKGSSAGAGRGAVERAQRVVRPVDIVFRPEDRILVVTGGNAGGKTVCLKTLGLCVAMTLAGLPVPVAAGSHLPAFRRVDAFIGDEQSLEANVSTFTAQIEHLAKAWKHLDGAGLVLLDEFGSGTDPAQGAALAQAVLDALLEKRTFVLTATHFPALKGYALATEGVRAASMLFDEKTRRPLYSLAYDQVGASQALVVAKEHGLPEEILERARRYLLQDGEDTEAVLARLNDLAARREAELKKLAEEQNQAKNAARRYRERLDADRTRLQEEVRQQARELMQAWKADKVTHKQALKQMATLRANLAKEQAKAEREEEASRGVDQGAGKGLAVGDSVVHTVFRKRGVVTDIDAKRSRVRLDMGGVALWADMNVIKSALAPDGTPSSARLGATQAAPAASSGAPQGKVFGRVPERALASQEEARRKARAEKERGEQRSAGDASSQSARHAAEAAFVVDLRGMRAHEAVERLQAALDRAYLAEMKEVEVVHGKGTGALRKAVHAYLDTCSQVEAYSLANADRGGDGMTVVTLR